MYKHHADPPTVHNLHFSTSPNRSPSRPFKVYQSIPCKNQTKTSNPIPIQPTLTNITETPTNPTRKETKQPPWLTSTSPPKKTTNYCWWFRNPKQPPGMVLKTCGNNGVNKLPSTGERRISGCRQTTYFDFLGLELLTKLLSTTINQHQHPPPNPNPKGNKKNTMRVFPKIEVPQKWMVYN